MHEPSVPRSYRLFVAGVLIFALAKLYLLAVTYGLSGMARLGDDGLIYLWKGQLSWMGDGGQYPALRDILSLESAAPPQHATRTAASQVYSGTVRPLADLFYGAVLRLGFDLKWSAFTTEIVGLGLMTAGIASLLLKLFGPAAAGIGLIFLAFGVLPNQGIYSYIPSTMALSLGFLLWARLYSTPTPPLAGAIAGFVMASVHPAGKLYALLGILFHAVSRKHWASVPDRAGLTLYGALVAGVLTGSLWPLVWSPFALPGHILTGGLNLAADFLLANGRHAASLVLDPLLRKNWPMIVLALLGLTVYRRQAVTEKVALLALAFAALCIAALAHDLPGYPAELFSRLLVPTVVLLAGIAGGATLTLVQQRGIGPKATGLVLMAGFLFLAVLWCRGYAFGKLNERTEVVDEATLSKLLGSLPADTVILYPEVDITINTSLLVGGYRYGAFVYPSVAGWNRMGDELAARKPTVVLAREPAALNSLAGARLKTFQKRRLGFLMAETAAVKVEVPDRHAFFRLFLLVDNPGVPIELQVSGTGAPRKIHVPGGMRGWVSVWDGPSTTRLSISLPRHSAWIEGISTNPADGLMWPWASEADVSWGMRSARNTNSDGFRQRFTPLALLEANRATSLAPWLHPERPFRAEGGGFVLLNTRFADVTHP